MGKRFGVVAAAVGLAAGIAAPAGATTVLTQIPSPIFGDAGGPAGGSFDLSSYLWDSAGRQFVITSATMSLKAHSDPHYGAPKTKTTTEYGALTLATFDPLTFVADDVRTTTIDYVDALADSLTLYLGAPGSGPSVSGTVSQVLDTTDVENLGVTEAPWSGPFPLPYPATVRTTDIRITNHKAIYGALDLSYAYDTAGLGDLNFSGSAFYLALPGLPGFIPDFGTFPTNGDFVLDSITFAFERTQVAGPPLPEPTAGVPEPATWAMLVMGFGTLGAMLRRRRAVLA